MNTELVKIDPKEYGLEEKKAAEISAQFKPMLDKMVELEAEYNKIISLEISKETSIKAKELRLKYVKVRTGTAAIHKQQKEFYLAGGRFVDGWKNAQLFASQGIEEKLEAIEKHYENLEIERLKVLHNERNEILKHYGVDGSLMPLATMTEDVWNNYLTGVKLSFEHRKEAERKAEEDRIAKEKADAEERERIKIENEKLKKEAEERERVIAEERKKAEAEKLKVEELARKEREKSEAEAKKLREENEAILRKEKEERERVEKELADKKSAEELAEKQRLEKIESELSKGDADKFKDLINDLVLLKSKYQFKSKKYASVYSAINDLIDKTIIYGNSKV